MTDVDKKEMLEKINKYAAKRAVEKEKENRRVVSDKERIMKLAPRIKNLIEVANACQDAGIDIKDFCVKTKHSIGFVKSSETGKVNQMLVYGGDLCTVSDFFVDGETIQEVCRCKNKRAYPPTNFTAMFLEEFDVFEMQFCIYVNNVAAA